MHTLANVNVRIDTSKTPKKQTTSAPSRKASQREKLSSATLKS